MTEHSKADEARKGLIDSVKGKAKEVLGAVTRNDSLTAEGQLEQTQAKERKEANTVEAVADAEAAQARAEAAEAQAEGRRERIAVEAETVAVESSVRNQQSAQKRAAELVGQQDVAREKTRAELDAQAKIQQAKGRESARDRFRGRTSGGRRRRSSGSGAGRIQRRGGSRSHQTAGRRTDRRSRPALSIGKTQESSMRIIDAPLAVLRIQYRIARLPLQIIEERVVARMGSETPARLLYERSLGMLDAAVGNALGDTRLEERGRALAERSDALSRASRLDATADEVRRESNADLRAKATRRSRSSETRGPRASATSRKPGPRPRSASVRRNSRPRSGPPPPRSRPTKWQAAEQKKPRRPSAPNKPGFARSNRRQPSGDVEARRCSSKAHRGWRQACAGGQGRGVGRRGEEEAPNRAGEQHLTDRRKLRPNALGPTAATVGPAALSVPGRLPKVLDRLAMRATQG